MTKKSSEDAYLYETVADRIEGLIEGGTLLPGDRVPSVRKLSQQERVSLSTVLQAYFLLENKGLIEAHPQSGYYVRLPHRDFPPEPSISRPSTSARPVSVGDLVIRVIEVAQDHRIVPLGAACPSPELFPDRLDQTLAAVARRAGGAARTFDTPPGCAELRRQIARRSLEWGGSLSADDIVLTNGCTEALNLCLRAVAEPGDTIVVESPTYFGILQILESLKMRALEIPTHPGYGICLDALERALKRNRVKACFVMTNFHNPLGSTMPDENKQELVTLLSMHDVPLIEDDIYSDLYFGTKRPRLAKAFDRKGLVLLCQSFSKTLSPGYRLGWSAPGRFKEQVKRLKLMTTLATATLPSIALAEYLQHGGYDRHLRNIRKAFASQVQIMTQAIGEHFPSGTRVTRPSGGFVLWVEMPRSVDALDLYESAFAKGISVAPGHIFSAKQTYRNFIRLNCGFPWTNSTERAIATLGRLAGELATH